VKRGPGAAVVHLQHLEIAVRVPERGERSPADVLLNADRLSRLVIEKIELRQLLVGLPS
jgi:hypothetical protein